MAGSWNPVNELSEHDGYLSCCRFVPGSVDSQLLTSSGDASCILWDVEYNTPMQIFDDHSTDVMCLDVTERTFVSGSCDGTAKLWDLRQLESVMTFVGHESDVNSVRFFPDGFSFGTGSDDSTCRLFDSRSYGQVNVYVNDHILGGVTSVDFSASGRYLFAGLDDYRVLVWDVQAGTMVQALNEHTNRVSCLGVGDDGNALCTGSWDAWLKIWA